MSPQNKTVFTLIDAIMARMDIYARCGSPIRFTR
jgi:hypothetical protein